MSEKKNFFKGPFVPKTEIEKPIHFLPPKEEQKIVLKNKKPWYCSFNTKSNEYYKLDRDFKDANLEGTPFYFDYRIKKN
jgi:hypothetical protein